MMSKVALDEAVFGCHWGYVSGTQKKTQSAIAMNDHSSKLLRAQAARFATFDW